MDLWLPGKLLPFLRNLPLVYGPRHVLAYLLDGHETNPALGLKHVLEICYRKCSTTVFLLSLSAHQIMRIFTCG